MIIIGAGLSGLIAASMLRDDCSAIFEKQSALPNNHSALLRFRSPVVGDAVGIPFKKVKVMKAVDRWKNPVADALSYSIKSLGKAELRSVTSAYGKIEDRYIAPDDFIDRLAVHSYPKLAFDQSFADVQKTDEAIISTIPMPALMAALKWEDKPEFKFVGGEVISCDLPPGLIDACVTVYVPSPYKLPYRVSVTESRLIIEISSSTSNGTLSIPEVQEAITDALEMLGLKSMQLLVQKNFTHKQMKYAKIAPIDERVRKQFIMWASDKHNIFSLGRFATWRPGLLLDDIVNDVRVIQRLAQNPGETYAHKMKG